MRRGAGRGRLVLFWVAGVDLRITVLCLPPLIPLIHHDLRIDERTVGLLNGMTPLVMAVMAIPGSLLVARVGARKAIVSGFGLVALAGAARGAGPSVAVLLAATLVMAVGIALVQPAFPTLVRDWFFDRAGFATATYSNGLLVGEIVPAALALPVAWLLGGSWELSLAAWSLPVVVTAVLIALARGGGDRAERTGRWWPDWSDPNIWLLGAIFGSASALYWSANAFIPDLFAARGDGAYVGAALSALNAAQVPASVLIGVFSRQLVGRRWPFITGAAVTAAGLAALLLLPGIAAVVAAGVLGVVAGGILVLVLAVPPVLAAPGDVHRMSAGIFTVTYTCSFLAPLLGGAAWDASHQPLLAFSPIVLAVVALALAGSRVRLVPAT